jgi:hypothetical protein
VAKIKVPNKAPASTIEEILSVRWGVRVQFTPGQSLVWLPNQRYEFVSVIPGQQAKMTEPMRTRLDSERPPEVLKIWITVCDGFVRYPSEVSVSADASLDRLMQVWSVKASETPSWDISKFPAVASRYSIRNADEKQVTSMDGTSAAYAQFLASDQPRTPTPRLASPVSSARLQRRPPRPPPAVSTPIVSSDDKPVIVKIIYHHIDENRKPERAHVRASVSPDESEQELLERCVRGVLTDGYRDHRVQIARNMSKKMSD